MRVGLTTLLVLIATLSVLAIDDVIITVEQGGSQSTYIETQFPQPLVIVVKTKDNQPSQALVIIESSYAGDEPGASFEYAYSGNYYQATPDSNGRLSVIVIANSVVGPCYIDIRVQGATTKRITLYNNGEPKYFSSISGQDQLAVANTPFANKIRGRLIDASNHPVVFTNITFGVDVIDGATCIFPGNVSSITVQTDTDGYFETSALAGTKTGYYYVVATAADNPRIPSMWTLTNTYSSGRIITAISGQNQTTTVNTNFTDQLGALVTDEFGNPVPGLIVSFVFPNSAASAYIIGLGLVWTNASGIAATSIAATSVAGSFSVKVMVASDSITPLLFNLANAPDVPDHLEFFIDANPQPGQNTFSASVNETFMPIHLRLFDQFGNAVPNHPVQFEVVSLPASNPATIGFFLDSSHDQALEYTTQTNSSGHASSGPIQSYLGAGSFSINVTVPDHLDNLNLMKSFVYTILPAKPSVIKTNYQSSAEATVGEMFDSLELTVYDKYDNTVLDDVTVELSIDANYQATAHFSNGGTDSGFVSLPTDGQGRVVGIPSFSANQVAGTYNLTISAKVDGTIYSQLTIPLTNIPGPVTLINVVSGADQKVKVADKHQLAVQLFDEFNNTVNGRSVTFKVNILDEASADFDGSDSYTTDSNSNGVATAVFTSNQRLGEFRVQITADKTEIGVSQFNIPNDPAHFKADAGLAVVVVNQAFPDALRLTVTDAYNNTIPNTAVEFTSPTTGPSLFFGGDKTNYTLMTDGAGSISTQSLRANQIAGTYDVLVRCPGYQLSATFSYTNTPDIATNLSISSGDAQSTSTGTQFAQPLSVLVKDKYNNAVAGVTVVFIIHGNSSSVFANGLTTSSAVTTLTGRASSPLITAGTELGPFTVTANVTALGQVSFSLSIVEPPVASPIQTPAEPISGPSHSSVPSSTPVRDDAGTISSATTVAINCVALFTFVSCCF